QELLGATLAREDHDFFPLCHCLTFLPEPTPIRTKLWRSQHSILEENPPPRDAAGGRLTSPQESARVCHIQRLNASGTHVHTKIDVKPARCGANFPAYWSVRFCGNPIPEPGKRCAQRPHIVRLAIQDKALRSGNTRSRSCVPLTGREIGRASCRDRERASEREVRVK